MTLRATRRPVRELDPAAYTCRRCGITKATHSKRQRPVLCRDCRQVVAAIRVLEVTGADVTAPDLLGG